MLSVQLLVVSTLPAVGAFTSISTHVPSRSLHARSSPIHSTFAFGTEYLNVNELAERNIDTFQSWIDSVGIQKAPGVILKGSDRYLKNVQMVASQDVAAGSPVLYVPEELIMSSNKAMAAYRNNQMEGAEQQLKITDAMTEIRQYYLMIQLLVEIERGTARYVQFS